MYELTEFQMISGEAPVLFAKACEMFILELTLRSWTHTEENKRRTLQKVDVVSALNRHDMYDFLIDVVPRDEIAGAHSHGHGHGHGHGENEQERHQHAQQQDQDVLHLHHAEAYDGRADVGGEGGGD
ncbi:hypothetical protein HDU82_000719 [Entophlyctis luteolus]|nr:hypothetical protein HDU82_000719 [Entophlyctis luteolus]